MRNGEKNGNETGGGKGMLFQAELAPVCEEKPDALIPHSPFPNPHSQLPAPHSQFPVPHSLWEEYRALGFLRRNHPLALWKEQIARLKRIKAVQISGHVGRSVRLVGWPITQKEVWTKDGLTMSFLSLEDETALYETVVFPNVYERYNKLLFEQQPLLVYGRVVDDQGAIILELDKIEKLSYGAFAGPGISS